MIKEFDVDEEDNLKDDWKGLFKDSKWTTFKDLFTDEEYKMDPLAFERLEGMVL